MRGLARRWLVWALLWLAVPLGAQDVLPVPALGARVIDQTGTLSDAERAQLEARLAAFEAEAGPQIVVLMVPTTRPEDIAAYAQRVADTWKIGRREVGDGLLIVVAKDDRRIRIEVAKALEGAVPDLAARQVIDRAMMPAFRAGDFAGGLATAIDQLIARIKGEGLPAPGAREPRGGAGIQWEELAVFLFVAVPIVGSVLSAMLGRKLGSLATAGAAGAFGWWFGASVLLALLVAAVALVLVGVIGIGGAARHVSRHHRHRVPPVWGGGWGGGGPGRGGGFGGFRSGGGGNFGGGGASGGW